MASRLFGGIAVLVVFSFMVATVTVGQNTSPAKQWKAPRTPAGEPDLQGVWTTSTLTPLERPPDLAGKQFFTEQEAAEYEKRIFAQVTGDRRDGSAEADL